MALTEVGHGFLPAVGNLHDGAVRERESEERFDQRGGQARPCHYQCKQMNEPSWDGYESHLGQASRQPEQESGYQGLRIHPR